MLTDYKGDKKIPGELASISNFRQGLSPNAGPRAQRKLAVKQMLEKMQEKERQESIRVKVKAKQR